jgi:hypothetical protein
MTEFFKYLHDLNIIKTAKPHYVLKNFLQLSSDLPHLIVLRKLKKSILDLKQDPLLKQRCNDLVD